LRAGGNVDSGEHVWPSKLDAKQVLATMNCASAFDTPLFYDYLFMDGGERARP